MTIQDVKFNLWAVLTFLMVSGVVAVGFLYAEGKEIKLKQQEVIQRVIKLETNYEYIMKGIERLTVAAEQAAEKLDKHRMHTESRPPR